MRSSSWFGRSALVLVILASCSSTSTSTSDTASGRIVRGARHGRDGRLPVLSSRGRPRRHRLGLLVQRRSVPDRRRVHDHDSVQPAIPSKWKARGYDHIGDIDVVDNVVYAPLEQPDYTIGKQAMLTYDATTLAYRGGVEIAQHENSFVTVDRSTHIAYSMDRFGGRALTRYDTTRRWRPLTPLAMRRHVDFAPVFGLVVCWTGDLDEGERVLAPIREVAQPVMDMVGPMPYAALQGMLDAGGPPGISAYMKAEFLPELSDEAIAVLIGHGAARPGPLVQLLLEPMGGAISRVDPEATALGHRDAPWCYHALSMWMEPGQEAADAHIGWARGLADAMAPHVTAGAYLNFTSDAGEERVRSAYGPATYARLVELKDRFDPTNLFHLNQNILPSARA